MIKTIKNIKNKKGFYTIEALVSLVIFMTGILGVVGIQASAIGNNSNATYRAEASFLADAIIAEMWTDRNNLTSYAAGTAPAYTSWLTEVNTRLPGSIINPPIITVSGQAVAVTVRWQDFKTSQILNYRASATILNQ